MSNPAVQHSTLSLSGRERWSQCPASVKQSVGYTDEGSVFAQEGTEAHAVGEFYVRQKFNLPGAKPGECPDRSMPQVRNDAGEMEPMRDDPAAWNAELRAHGKAYAAFIESLIPPGMRWGVDVFVSLETKVAAQSIDGRLFGTADCLIWFPALRLLIVVDYKYGVIAVEVGTPDAPNKQISGYAIAAIDKLTGTPPTGVTLAVFQPRSIGATEQKIDLTMADLAAETARLRAEVAEVDLPNPKYALGDHCRYCKGKAGCPKVIASIQTTLDVGAGLRSVLDMPDDELLDLYSASTAIKNVLDDVKEKVVLLQKSGHPRISRSSRPGNRAWADPSMAVRTLLALGMDKHLKPGNVTDVCADLPAEYQEGLIKRYADVVTYKVNGAPQVSEVGATFAKYSKSPVDKSGTND